MIANKVEELFNKIGKNHFDDEYCVEYETYIVSLKEIKMLYDYIEQLIYTVQDTYDSANDTCGELQQRIDKAIEYNNHLIEHAKYHLNVNHIKKSNKILKGGE